MNEQIFNPGLVGGLAPTRGESTKATKAAVPWARHRDLPDVGALADYAAQPELVHELLTHRIRQHWFPMSVQQFPLPKPGGGHRPMSWMDPVDEIALRIIVGRMTSSLRAACPTDVVFSYPLLDTGAGWSTKPYREAQAHRRERGQALADDEHCHALGVLDVASYYPSVNTGLLAEDLNRLGAPPGAVEALRLSLDRLPELGGSSGLPMGFEGSGLLGNVYLISADAVAASTRTGLVRYTDDTWLFLPEDVDWSATCAEYRHLLAQKQLQLNESKTRLIEKGKEDLRSVIAHGLLDSITEGDSRTVSVDEALEIIGIAIDEADELDEPAAKFGFGALAREGDPRGVAILQANPEVFDQIPQKAANYLASLAQSRKGRRAIDHDWVVELACRVPDDATAAGQLHACRVAACLAVSKRHGQRLLELATDHQRAHQVPLQAWAACAWTKSKHWRPARAAEAVRHHNSLSVRRSLILGFCDRRGGNKTARLATELQEVEPDLAATIAFAMS